MIHQFQVIKTRPVLLINSFTLYLLLKTTVIFLNCLEVHPEVINSINFSVDEVHTELVNLQKDKACGPDCTLPIYSK